jgi:hypothetical protein
MNVARSAVSATVTRYRVTARLGPNSDVLLVRPEDGSIMTRWRSTGDSCSVVGEWISSYDNLIGVVRGIEVDQAVAQPDGGDLTAHDRM